MRRRLQLAEEDDDDSTMVHKTPRRWNEEWRFGWLGVLQDTIPYRIGRGVKVVVRLSSPGQRTPTTVGLVTQLWTALLGLTDQTMGVSSPLSLQQFIQENSLRISRKIFGNDDWMRNGATCASGVMSFGATLAVSTWVQQRWIGISTGSACPLPSVVGVLSVCLAAKMSHQVAECVQHYMQHHHHGDWASMMANYKRIQWNPVKDSSKELMRIGTVPITQKTVKM